MHRRTFSTWLAAVPALGGALPSVAATLHDPSRRIDIDVTRIADGREWDLLERRAGVLESGTRRGIRLDERGGGGMALLRDFRLSDGTIECDIRGQDVLQKSFVGLAFHAHETEAADIVYFRPFNFRADDPARRSHAVQYISAPGFGWKTLREEHPGEYESAVDPVPDPDGWFRARIVVDGRHVAVFVNDGARPCLSVDKLNERTTGRIGLWVGDESGGDFANLRVTPR